MVAGLRKSSAKVQQKAPACTLTGAAWREAALPLPVGVGEGQSEKEFAVDPPDVKTTDPLTLILPRTRAPYCHFWGHC
jgi:hypothetical protein